MSRARGRVGQDRGGRDAHLSCESSAHFSLGDAGSIPRAGEDDRLAESVAIQIDAVERTTKRRSVNVPFLDPRTETTWIGEFEMIGACEAIG